VLGKPNTFLIVSPWIDWPSKESLIYGAAPPYQAGPLFLILSRWEYLPHFPAASLKEAAGLSSRRFLLFLPAPKIYRK
jgi:hypothetical protein